MYKKILTKEHNGYLVEYIQDTVNNRFEIHQVELSNPSIYSSHTVDELAETPEDAIELHIEWMDEQAES